MQSAIRPVLEIDTTVASQSSYMKVLASGGSFQGVFGKLIGWFRIALFRALPLHLTFSGERFAAA